jgi:hypothetical protein
MTTKSGCSPLVYLTAVKEKRRKEEERGGKRRKEERI